MQTQTETSSKKPQKSRQVQVPGTEKGSKALRDMHDQYAIAKYEAKEAAERMKAIKPDLIEKMEEEGVDSLNAEVEYGEEVRNCITTLTTKAKLSSKLEAAGDDD